jgi:hypothetical protein
MNLTKKDASLKYQVESEDIKCLFNLIEYEDGDQIDPDVNERFNKKKLNLLAANFILYESDIELTKSFSLLFKRLILKWPNLVKFADYLDQH